MLEGLTGGWVWLRLRCVVLGLGVGRGLTMVSFVNLCQGLVGVGQAGAALSWGEGYGAALLFCVSVAGDGGSGVWLGERGGEGKGLAWALGGVGPVVAARCLSPPTSPPPSEGGGIELGRGWGWVGAGRGEMPATSGGVRGRGWLGCSGGVEPVVAARCLSPPT